VRIAIVMQRMAPDMESGQILEWKKAVGDQVTVGDDLLEVATDKVDVVMEAMDAGTLVEIVGQPEDEVPVGEVIGWLESAG
jgi:pyruvate/2-oxoglutarate dehydrogenase complex dihydrolipoamide acyltransferase (E2) component